MDTINDYILWRGDLSFQKDAFHTLDAIVLCQITYFDMNPFFSTRTEGTLAEIYDYLLFHDALNCTLVGMHARTKKIFQSAAASRRYRNIRISRYRDVMNDEYALQFAAATYRIGNGCDFVAFRGTDSSLAGWKEDCMISFRKTMAQDMALSYLKQAAAVTDCRQVFVGGHSKGANLAMYAAAMMPEILKDRITKVFVFDGPGFCPEVLETECLRALDAKTEMVIPEESIFGRIFDPQITATTIVKSTEIGIAQHDMSSWRVDHLRLQAAKKTSLRSNLFVSALMQWVNELELSRREEIVEKVFAQLYEDADFFKQKNHKLKLLVEEINQIRKHT